MNFNYSCGCVAVEKISHDPETLTTTYRLQGLHDNTPFEGEVTFYDGGDFDTELDHDVVVTIFTELDEANALSSL